jgi:hypothetical protein
VIVIFRICSLALRPHALCGNNTIASDIGMVVGFFEMAIFNSDVNMVKTVCLKESTNTEIPNLSFVYHHLTFLDHHIAQFPQ